MTLRVRLTVLVSVIVGACAFVAGFGAYRVASNEAYETIDDSLDERGARLAAIITFAISPSNTGPPLGPPPGATLDPPPGAPLESGQPADGEAGVGPVPGRPVGPPPLGPPPPGPPLGPPPLGPPGPPGGNPLTGPGEEPVMARVSLSSVAEGARPQLQLLLDTVDESGGPDMLPERPATSAGNERVEFADIALATGRYRVRTDTLLDGTVIQVGRSLDETDSTLASIRRQLWILGLGIVALAVALSYAVSRRLARPLEQLSESAEHVAATGDLSTEFEHDATGEVGKVSDSFRSMLRTLDASQQQQRQLVADAGHELRTPLTTLRTNAELLRTGKLTPADTDTAAGLIVSETAELAKLTNELVELAASAHEAEAPVDLDVADIATAAAHRAGRRHGLDIVVDAEPSPLSGQPAQLDRAITNLLDNAAKFSPPDGAICVWVRPGEIWVADEGSGIDAADLPRLFDRFYRSAQARALPGSGLGLAIVAKVADAHGGTTFARNNPDRGATVGFTFAAPDVAPTIE